MQERVWITIETTEDGDVNIYLDNEDAIIVESMEDAMDTIKEYVAKNL